MSDAAHQDIEVFPDWESLAGAVATRLADALGEGLRRRGRASLALAGGRTPCEIYRRLSRRPLRWDKVDVTLTDERWVDEDSLDSNARLIRCKLMKGEASEARLIPLKASGADPDAVAHAADEALAAAAVFPLDAVLLGMGGDGHFASLFPASPALARGLDPDETATVIAVAAGEPAPPQPRLSLTLRALIDARGVTLAIRGEEKRRALAEAHAHGDVRRAPVLALLRQTRAPVRIAWAP